MNNCNIFDVWDEHQSLLLAYINKRVPVREDARDILQDVLLKSYQFCATGKTVLYLKAWLYRITQNSIANYYRQKAVTIDYSLEVMDETAERSAIGEASDYIKALIQLLPGQFAAPLYMSDIEGIHQKTIAATLGLTLPNTKSRIQRARIHLKNLFLTCCDVSFGDSGEMVSFAIKPGCTLLQNKQALLTNTR